MSITAQASPKTPVLSKVAGMVVPAALLLSVVGLSNVSASDFAWKRIEVPANGVSLKVPLGVFEPVDNDADAGRLFASADRKAQLLVGAFANVDNRSIAEHQRFVIDTKYATANLDYAPRRRNWFVISGTMDTRTFYHRVTFTCRRRQINSWAMIYPTAQKGFYDALVERMHRSFRPSHGPRGDCRQG